MIGKKSIYETVIVEVAPTIDIEIIIHLNKNGGIYDILGTTKEIRSKILNKYQGRQFDAWQESICNFICACYE